MRFKDTVGISYLLKNAENVLRNAIDTELRGLGLSLAQYSALSALEMNGSLTNAELARECHVTAQTMNRIVAGLTRAKLLKKSESEKHGLKINYELTPRAEKLICDAHMLVDVIEKKAIKGLNKNDLKIVQKAMKLFCDNI